MVKKPDALKKAAREERTAAEDAEVVAAAKAVEPEEEPADGGDPGKEKKQRKPRKAKMRRDNKKKRELEANKDAHAKLDKAVKADEDYMHRRIYVGNIPEGTTSEDLRELFAKFGTVHSARITMDSRGRAKNCAFVTFEGADEVDQAIQMHGMEFKKNVLKVEKATPPPKKEVCEVYVGGLPFTVEETKLRKNFKSCGEIKAVRMNIDWQKKKFNGTAFIMFKTGKAAQAALKLHDSAFAGRTLFVKLALPKKKIKLGKEEVEDETKQETKPESKRALKKAKAEKAKLAAAKKEKKAAASAAPEAVDSAAGGDSAGAGKAKKGKKRTAGDEAGGDAAEAPEKKKKKLKKKVASLSAL